MLVENSEVLRMLLAYLAVHPEDEWTLKSLLGATERPDPVTSRKTKTGHVTCGVIAVTSDRTVLQIHHRGLDRWLLPGGHIDADDLSLLDAALRELHEETGIDPSTVSPIGELPIDVDAHVIPDNPEKNEPAHTHYDLRFLVSVDAPAGANLQLQDAEVANARWRNVDELTGRLRQRVQAALSQQA